MKLEAVLFVSGHREQVMSSINRMKFQSVSLERRSASSLKPLSAVVVVVVGIILLPRGG